MDDNVAENLAKLCQKADQPAPVIDVAVAATATHDRAPAWELGGSRP